MTQSSRETLHFVPSILLSTTMSLAPKIDEIAHTITTMGARLALFTETWLRSTVPDEPINMATRSSGSIASAGNMAVCACMLNPLLSARV